MPIFGNEQHAMGNHRKMLMAYILSIQMTALNSMSNSLTDICNRTAALSTRDKISGVRGGHRDH